jgi:hypothetical protein
MIQGACQPAPTSQLTADTAPWAQKLVSTKAAEGWARQGDRPGQGVRTCCSQLWKVLLGAIYENSDNFSISQTL